MDPLLNFIDGAFVPSAAGATLETVNPATGAVITTLPRSNASDVQTATTAPQGRSRVGVHPDGGTYRVASPPGRCTRKRP